MLSGFRKLGFTQVPFKRFYRVLAIETSCDDTCAAIIDRTENSTKVLAHVKITLNSVSTGGIIPTDAYIHHQMSIGNVVKQCLDKCQSSDIDLVCATRGPGMPGSLSIGLDFGKGLSVAWKKPFLGVHHMLGHLLVPRMASNGVAPQFPFISLLVSGGHTMLVYSSSVSNHEIILDTLDIAVGDALDKCGREIGIRGNMIAREMEAFINDQLPINEVDSVEWALPNPLRNKPKRVNNQAFSFSPFISAVRKSLEMPIDQYTDKQRASMAFQIQEAIFKHIIMQIQLTLKLRGKELNGATQFVCSGGVAANKRLRTLLEQSFGDRFESFHYPSLEICSDNAIMIGWAGIELFESQGLTSNLSVTPIRKWPLPDLLEVPGWQK